MELRSWAQGHDLQLAGEMLETNLLKYYFTQKEDGALNRLSVNNTLIQRSLEQT